MAANIKRELDCVSAAARLLAGQRSQIDGPVLSIKSRRGREYRYVLDELVNPSACLVLAKRRDVTVHPTSAYVIDDLRVSGLGFRFCDWIVKPDFIAAFEQKLGHRMKIVHPHL